MAEMTKEKWIKAGLEIAEHLKAIDSIIKRNDIDLLSIGVVNNLAWATYREDLEDGENIDWEVSIDPSGTKVKSNYSWIYTQT